MEGESSATTTGEPLLTAAPVDFIVISIVINTLSIKTNIYYIYVFIIYVLGINE